MKPALPAAAALAAVLTAPGFAAMVPQPSPPCKAFKVAARCADRRAGRFVGNLWDASLVRDCDRRRPMPARQRRFYQIYETPAENQRLFSG